jgi:hypothetical protein
MQLLTVTNTPIEIGTSPFFQSGESLLFGVGGLLQGGADAAGTGGWTNIGVATVAGVPQLVTLGFPWVRVSTAATVQLVNN